MPFNFAVLFAKSSVFFAKTSTDWLALFDDLPTSAKPRLAVALAPPMRLSPLVVAFVAPVK